MLPLILTLLPLLGILLLVLLILSGFGSRHCVPPSVCGTQPACEYVPPLMKQMVTRR
jgi:hypothetical protein